MPDAQRGRAPPLPRAPPACPQAFARRAPRVPPPSLPAHDRSRPQARPPQPHELHVIRLRAPRPARRASSQLAAQWPPPSSPPAPRLLAPFERLRFAPSAPTLSPPAPPPDRPSPQLPWRGVPSADPLEARPPVRQQWRWLRHGAQLLSPPRQPASVQREQLPFGQRRFRPAPPAPHAFRP